MEGGENKEENNTEENEEEAPANDNAPPVPSAVALSPPKSTTSQRAPSRSITPPTKSRSRIMEQTDANKSAIKTPERVDESEEQPVLTEKSKFQSNLGINHSVGPLKTISTFPAAIGEYGTGGIFKKRSPFIHDPPQPEERRIRYSNPRTPREYIINLRENLADFQESHGLPRTRDYSFLSLGLALAQETARAIYSVLLMFAELFPILAIVSLILRFALDNLIEILETVGLVPRLKKALIFAVEMIVILIPLWILIGSIVIPLISLIFAMFAKVLRLNKGKKSCSGK